MKNFLLTAIAFAWSVIPGADFAVGQIILGEPCFHNFKMDCPSGPSVACSGLRCYPHEWDETFGWVRVPEEEIVDGEFHTARSESLETLVRVELNDIPVSTPLVLGPGKTNRVITGSFTCSFWELCHGCRGLYGPCEQTMRLDNEAIVSAIATGSTCEIPPPPGDRKAVVDGKGKDCAMR